MRSLKGDVRFLKLMSESIQFYARRTEQINSSTSATHSNNTPRNKLDAGSKLVQIIEKFLWVLVVRLFLISSGRGFPDIWSTH